MTTSHHPAIKLLQAALDPAHAQARTRADSPVSQVIFRAVAADLVEYRDDNVQQLAVGVGVAAALLTAFLAQEREKQPETLLTAVSTVGAGMSSATLDLLKKMLAGPVGMEQAAQFLARLFQDDAESFYDLIVDLSDYSATCIEMLERFGISGRQQTLDDLEDALKA